MVGFITLGNTLPRDESDPLIHPGVTYLAWSLPFQARMLVSTKPAFPLPWPFLALIFLRFLGLVVGGSISPTKSETFRAAEGSPVNQNTLGGKVIQKSPA